MPSTKKQKTTWELLFDFQSRGGSALSSVLGAMSSKLSSLNNAMFNAGVTTIFVDRLMQSFVRAWRALNDVIGASKLGEAANAFLRISEVSGVATDKLQAFTSASALVGAELEDVSDLLQTVAERVDDVRAGEKGISDDFARYGMGKNDFAGMTNSLDMYLRMADAFMAIGDPSRRMAGIEKILGGDLGRKFGQLMVDGSSGLIKMMQEAAASGAVLSRQELEMAKAYYDAQIRVRRAIGLVSQALGAMLMPYLKRTWTLIADVLERTAKFLRFYGGLKQWFEGLLTPLLDRVQNGLQVWDRYYKSIEETVYRLARGALVVLGIAAGKSVGPLMSVGASLIYAFGLATLLADDLITYFYDQDPTQSWIGKMIKSSPLLQDILAMFVASATSLGYALDTLQVGWSIFVNGPLLPLAVRFFGLMLTSIAGALLTTSQLITMFVYLASVIAEMIDNLMQFNDIADRIGVIGAIRSVVQAPASVAFAGMGQQTTSSAMAMGTLGMPTNNTVTINSPNPAQSAAAATAVKGRLGGGMVKQ